MTILYIYLTLSITAATIGVIVEIEESKPYKPYLPSLFSGLIIDLLVGPFIIIISLIEVIRGK